jgi:SAM-dependent methyltransferase
VPERTQRQRFQESFWNKRAIDHAHFNIVGHDDILDESRREETFERLGRESGRMLAPWVHPKSRVLDLGCGIGRVMKVLSPLCDSILGCDVSDEMIRRGHEYLAGLDNCGFLQVDGASLSEVEDDSVDFLYSMLALIHIDKRSAYRYYREFARVLRPGAAAWLQVQNMISEEGVKTFEGVVESDYPLEFYTAEEFAFLLRRVGLEPLHVNINGAFLEAEVVNGSASAWKEEATRALSISEMSATGYFADEALHPHDQGALSFRLANRGPRWHGMLLVHRLVPADSPEAPLLHQEAILHLEPGSEAVVTLDKPAGEPGATWRVESEGASRVVLPTREPEPPGAELPPQLQHLVAVFPAGVPRDPEGMAAFSDFAWASSPLSRRD